VSIFCIVGTQLAVAAESEDQHSWLESGFSLDLGVIFPDRELDLRVNGTLTGINDEIDFDKRSQFESADEVFAGEMAWRFRGRWSLVGQYSKSEETYRPFTNGPLNRGQTN